MLIRRLDSSLRRGSDWVEVHVLEVCVEVVPHALWVGSLAVLRLCKYAVCRGFSYSHMNHPKVKCSQHRSYCLFSFRSPASSLPSSLLRSRLLRVRLHPGSLPLPTSDSQEWIPCSLTHLDLPNDSLYPAVVALLYVYRQMPRPRPDHPVLDDLIRFYYPTHLPHVFRHQSRLVKHIHHLRCARR